jgi:hypothetical protein
MFLEGRDESPVAMLKKRMERAAVERRFETAAKLRDRLADIEWFAGRLESLRDARSRFNFVYPVTSEAGRTVWYVVFRGGVAAAVHPPGKRRTGDAGRRLIADWHASGRLEDAPLVDQHPTVSLLTHWFRTRPEELDRVLSVAEAYSLCRETATAVEAFQAAGTGSFGDECGM